MYEGFGLSESQINKNHFGGVINTVLTFSVVDVRATVRSNQRD